MLDANLISKNIVKLRKQRGLKQQDLAREIHYSDKVISKWERGESVPDVIALSALADFFEITLDEITRNIDIESEGKVNNKETNEIDGIIESIIAVENINDTNKQNTEVISAPKKLKRRNIFIFVPIAIAVVALAIFIPIFISSIMPKNYGLGDKIQTEYAYFQVNSIAYPQSAGSFTADSGMILVAIEIVITNRGFDINDANGSIAINKDDFKYSNNLTGSAAMHLFSNSSFADQCFFKSVEESLYGVSLEFDNTRKGYLVFSSPAGNLSNQKLTYTEYINETRAKTYIVNLPDYN